MKPFLVALFLVLAAGCAGTPPVRAVDGLLADHRFPRPARLPSADAVFELNDAMRQFAAERIAPHTASRGLRHGLLAAVREELRIDYDTAMTRTAAEAFERRSGNCLSLVILVGAFARHLGIDVRYQSVYGQDTWSRVAGLALRSGHINVALNPWGSDPRFRRKGDEPLIVDFIPVSAEARLYTQELSEDTVVAMYLNNRAAETLAHGDVAGAYWWARAALRTAPLFPNTYNTLGVIYLRHGDLPRAEAALRRALMFRPDNTEALSNLALVLAHQGLDDEARSLRQQLARIVPYPPFHFYDRGRAALARGEVAAALALFDRELQRMPYDDETHMAAAVAELQLGNVRRARRHLMEAVQYSSTDDRRRIYAAKLDHLQTLQAN